MKFPSKYSHFECGIVNYSFKPFPESMVHIHLLSHCLVMEYKV